MGRRRRSPWHRKRAIPPAPHRLQATARMNQFRPTGNYAAVRNQRAMHRKRFESKEALVAHAEQNGLTCCVESSFVFGRTIVSILLPTSPAAKPSSPPSGNKPTCLSDALACYCVSQRSINRKIPMHRIEGDGESCKKNPAQKAR
jgi:hypothetical protein